MNTPLAKTGGFGLRLKPDWSGIRPPIPPRSHHPAPGFFFPDVFLPYLIGHIPARHYPLTPYPEVPSPVTFADTLVLRQQLVRTFALLVLDCPGDRETRRDPYLEISATE